MAVRELVVLSTASQAPRRDRNHNDFAPCQGAALSRRVSRVSIPPGIMGRWTRWR